MVVHVPTQMKWGKRKAGRRTVEEASAMSRMREEAVCAGEWGSSERIYEEMVAMASLRIVSMAECMHPQIM